MKSYLATPVMKTTGTKTMQMHSVETKAGVAICCAPSRMARMIGLPIARLRLDVLDLDRGVVDEDADGERQAAERHHVEGLRHAAEQR